MTTIGSRVGAAMRSAGMQEEELAPRAWMTPDALSRAIRDERGFAALELAEIANVLGAEVHELITGEQDPHRLVFVGCHAPDDSAGPRL